MPYITTTYRPLDPVESDRHADATLFDARDEAAYRIEVITGGDPDYEEVYTDAQGCSELGDTFGPLPSGETVKVEPVTIEALTDMADAFIDGTIPDDPREREAAIIDAFNRGEEWLERRRKR